MNLTEWDKRMRSVEYPDRPSKPTLRTKKQASAKEVREYADKLEVYEQENDSFDKARKEYTQKMKSIEEEFKAWAIEECSLENLPNKDEVYAYAWQEGHSGGFSSVWNQLDELSELFHPYCK